MGERKIIPKNPKKVSGIDPDRKNELQKKNQELLKLIRSLKE